MGKPRRSVLVLDGDMVSSLTIARSLRKKGYSVDLASHIDNTLASHSRSVSTRFSYPDPLADHDAFIARLHELLKQTSYDLVIPVTERTLLPISRYRSEFLGAEIALPSQQSLEQVLDKTATFRIAEQLGIHVPFGYEITRMEELEHIQNMDFPVVLKPARSVGSDQNSHTQLKVDYAFTQEQLAEKAEYFLKFGTLIVQQYVRGEGVGVEILANYGEVVYAFQHLRLHEVPLTGGGSTLRKSVAMDFPLLEASRKLIKALNWHGVAMVEFKQNPDTRDFHLMEINGRFWGSLPLAAAAGADFPGMLADLLVDGVTEFPQGYREGIVCRRLTSDIHWYELALRKAAPAQLNVIPTKKQMLKDLLLVFHYKHRFDVQSFVDPLPGLVELRQVIKSYAIRLRDVLKAKTFFRKQHTLWQSGTVKQALASANTILFVCYGNINRSAVAEHYMRQQHPTVKLNIVSAGFHQPDGRPADPVMQQVASDLGVDLRGSRSKTITPDMVEKADVIFAMEKAHYDKLLKVAPDAGQRTFLLGGATSGNNQPIEISDPYGKSEQEYTDCFQRITRSVDALVNEGFQ